MTDATSAIVLTHNIDFLFLQSIVHSRLRKCGHPKLTVFADAACASGSYRQQRSLLDGLGRRYRVVQVEMGVGRRFHPKAILLAGPSKAALAIGSGNLTHGGWSANREIWASYESDDGGLHAISAFKEYLRTVERLAPQSESLSGDMFAPFDDSTNPWAADLPEPGDLYGVPGRRPLLDTIFELAGDDVQRVKVCAPYYDPEGEALSELSRRFPVSISTLLQRNHAGLSSSAVSALPENVELLCFDVDPSRFVHAKVYAFERPGSTLVVAGSANMSRAALMGNSSWGIAELVAIQSLSNEQANELFAEFNISDECPALPDSPPSEDWEIPTNPLRILAARFASGVLEIAFRSDFEIGRVDVELDDETWRPCSDFSVGGTARVQLSKCPASVRLHCTVESGKVMSSEPLWMDDEESLGVSVPERRIAAKLREAAEAGSLSASGMFEILRLLHEHLQQPAIRSGRTQTQDWKDTTSPGSSYSVDDVFSDGFGRPRINPVAHVPSGFREADFLRAFAAYFRVEYVEPSDESEQTVEGPLTGEDTSEGQELGEIENEKAKEEIEQRQARLGRPETSVRLRRRLMAALENVVTAMSADEFVSSRPPDRLSADIAATALLLRKGMADAIISEDDFADISKRLWTVLFFGSKKEPGALQKHMASCPPEDRNSVEAAVASPQLTAALTLWSLPDWGHDSTDAIRFRFSAMLLAARMPFLVSGASVEEIRGEMRRLARVMPGAAQFETLVAAWTGWIRAGMAFRIFEQSVGAWSAKQLADIIPGKQVIRGELLWQAGEFCVAHENYRRHRSTHAIVHPLTGASPIKYKGDLLVPVSALLSDTSLLNIADGAKDVLRSILAEIQPLEALPASASG